MKRIGFVMVAALALGACGEEATPSLVRVRIAKLVPALVDGAIDSWGTIGSAPGLAAATRVIDKMIHMVGVDASGGLGAGDAEISGADIANKLNTEVFTDAAYQGGGLYRVSDDLSVQVSVDGDGLDFTLVSGGREPIAIAIADGLLRATLDVAQLPVEARTAAGKASLRFGRMSDHAWTATVSVDEAIEFDNGRWVVAVQAGSPVASATVDLSQGTLAGTIDLGVAHLGLPWRDGTLGVTIQGITADVSLGDALSVRHLSFGGRPVDVDYDAAEILGVDVNPDAGNTVDVTFGAVLGVDAVAFTPRLRLDLSTGFQSVPALVDTVPAWLLGKRYEIRFGQSLASVDGGFGVGVEPLSIFADHDGGSTLTIPSGQCVVGDPLTAGEEPLLGRLAAGACPAN
jgi:hypothetical protein